MLQFAIKLFNSYDSSLAWTVYQLFILSILLSYPSDVALAQPSFLTRMQLPDNSNVNGFPNDITEDDEQIISALRHLQTYDNSIHANQPLGLIVLDKQNNATQLKTLGSPQGGYDWAYDVQSRNEYLSVAGNTAFLDSTPNTLFLYNQVDDTAWAKKLSGPRLGTTTRSVFNGENKLLTSYGDMDGWSLDKDFSIGFAQLEISTGIQIWAKNYQPLGWKEGFFPVEMLDRDNQVAVIGNITDTLTPPSTTPFLLVIDSIGNVKKSRRLGSDEAVIRLLDADMDAVGNLYAIGLISILQMDGTLSGNPFVAKFSPELELLWCKQLFAENFRAAAIVASATPAGETVFCYSSTGGLLTIAGSISTEGDLRWTQGYEFGASVMHLSEDGGMIFNPLYVYFNEPSDMLLLAKTTPDGRLPECPQFPACLILEDVELNVGDLEWALSPGPILPDVEVEVGQVDLISEPHCQTAEGPRPDFLLPDTLCIGDCARADSLRNALAHAYEWEVVAPDGMTTVLESDTLNLCFDQAGTYLVRQTIWLLGCTEGYERTVEVLPPLEVSLGQDRVWCQEADTLCPQVNRPVLAYQWQNGGQQACLPVTSSGQYGLSVSDGYCADSTVVNLTLLADTLTTDPFDFGNKDTLLCDVFFPYEVTVSSPVAVSLDGTLLDNNMASLERAGEYVVSGTVYGCPLTDTLQLRSGECPALLYLPTAFSPNGDGRNDVYRPLGKEFVGISLQVFDRWGGLLHQSDGPDVGWDGQVQGQAAPVGEYVIVLRYRNLRTGREEEVSQGVSLVR